MKALIGKVITGIEIDNAGQQYITFHREDDQPFTIEAEAECCSSTWFHQIMDPLLVIGETVLDVEDVEMPEPTNDEGDCIKYYGFVIRTAKGTCRVEYRNSSNGYYGGSYSEFVGEPDRSDVDMRYVLGDYTEGDDNNLIL